MNAPTVRQISVPTTIAGGEFTAIAGVTNEQTKVKELLRHPLVMPRAVILDPAHRPAHAGMAVAVDRHPRRRPLRRGHLLARGAALWRCAGAEGAFAAGAGAAAGEGRWQRSRRADGLPDRHLAVDGAAGLGRADGRQPRHRLCARRRVRRAARPYLLRDAAGGDALEQASQCRAPGAGRGGDGTSGRGRRRRARRLHPRPRHAAQPARGQGRPRAFRPHRASRRWGRPGCRATRARSTARRRCAKFSNWPHEGD